MPKTIRDQAIEWHDRLQRDRSAEALRAFEVWRAESPEHASEFDQQDRLTDAIGTLGWKPSSASMPKPRRRRPRILVGIAAGAFAAAAAAALFIWPLGGQTLSPESAIFAEAPASIERPVRLGDGTLVILAAGAQAVPHFSATMRRIILTGDGARFIVAPDRSRPLVVEAPGVRVTAASGVFDIDRNAAGVRVTAIKGVPAVTFDSEATRPDISATLLDAGKAITAGDGVATPAPDNAAGRVIVIEADSLPLGDVLKIANISGGLPVLSAEPALASRRVTGRFKVEDRRGLARRLAAALDLRLVDQGEHLRLATR